MNMTTYKLKDILTPLNLKNFFKEHAKWFQSKFSHKHILHIINNLSAFLKCKDLTKNFAIFKCPICNDTAVRPHTCKSKLCPCCGKTYSDKIAEEFANRMIDKDHRSILFSMPDYLWKLFIGRFHLLTELSDKLFLIFKKVFLDNKIHHFGFSMFFHTFGRDLKFYPHFHIVITEGGFKDDLTWKKLTYFHWQLFEGPWKKLLSDTLKNNIHPQVLKNKATLLWNENSEIFFNVKGQTIDNSLNAIKYLTRYLARPPIVEYKIVEVDNENITFWYEHVETKEKIYETMSIFKFIGRILIQIPPKNFKMIRHYGIYARNINKPLKSKLKLFGFKQQLYKLKLLWQDKIMKWIGFNPLKCQRCNVDMVIDKIIHEKKVYSFKT